MLQHLDLTDKADANMRALSGGMKRRVLVAQALVHKPPVIVLDEPTAGVDVELRQTLWQFVARLNRDGHTIVLTTHYLEEAEALCSRIAMLKAGRVVALDRTQRAAQRASSNVLRFKTDGALPLGAGASGARITGRIVQLPAHDTHELEQLPGRHARGRRARSRTSRCARPTSRRCSSTSWRASRRPGGSAMIINALDWHALLYKEMLRFWKVGFQTVAAPVLTAVLYLLIFGHVLEDHVQGLRQRAATPPSWCRAW